ncbi:MAG: DMT family transporter [Terriglobia bacterium]
MRSWFFLFSCNLMWALQFTCVKLVQDQVGPLFTVWGPMTLATVMLYPLVRAERPDGSAPDERRRSDAWSYLLLAALGVFPAQVLTTWGTRLSLASNAALINLTIPVSMAIMAAIILGERMTAPRWISFGLAIGGVLLCSGSDLRHMDFSRAYWAGNSLVFLGTMGSSFINTYGKKMMRRYTPMQMLFYMYVAAFVILTPLTLAQEHDVFRRIPQFSAQTWIGLALLTFFHNFLSMVLFLKALKKLDAIQAALSIYLVTFFGVPIAALWLGERLTLAGIAGGLLVLVSTLLITLWEQRRAVPTRAG